MNFNNMRSILMENKFKINYYNQLLNIVNYDSIGVFDSDKIVVNYDQGTLLIKGNNLFISKLLDDEILIEGIIKSIEFR